MTFKELMDSVEYEDVWMELGKLELVPDYEPQNPALQKVLFQKAFNSLRALQPLERACDRGARIIVIDFEDCNEDDWESSLDVSLVYPRNKNGFEERYGMENVAWENLLPLQLCEKSVLIYTKPILVAWLLEEITFFGFTPKAVTERADEISTMLDERVASRDRDIAYKGAHAFDGPSFLSHEQVFGKSGMTRSTKTQEEEDVQLPAMGKKHECRCRIFLEFLKYEANTR